MLVGTSPQQNSQEPERCVHDVAADLLSSGIAVSVSQAMRIAAAIRATKSLTAKFAVIMIGKNAGASFDPSRVTADEIQAAAASAELFTQRLLAVCGPAEGEA